MKRRPRLTTPGRVWLVFAFALIGLAAVGMTRIPTVRSVLIWRVEVARAQVLDWWSGRSDTLPTPSADAVVSTPVTGGPAVVASYEDSVTPARPTPTALPGPTALPPTATPVPLPPTVTLTGVKYEKQDLNNCGPATLAMMLSYWGWQGDQSVIADVLKPATRDKNVRWDELVYYVKTRAGWLDALFRVSGTIDGLKPFIADGYPVIIETGYTVKSGWVGHYLLLTGYDEAAQTFVVQDATGGPDRIMPYTDVDRDWQQFNRLFILVFPPADREKIMALLGTDADEATNRQRALDTAFAETERDPQNAFAWFNLGSNLNYFDRYGEAAQAFDKARQIGLPWRMLFYQFGPYRTYFNIGRYQDVIDLADAVLKARPDLEENFFWRGWARYMLGDKDGAIADFRSALEVNPGFEDARAALGSLGVAAH